MKHLFAILVAIMVLFAGIQPIAQADKDKDKGDEKRNFRAELTGYEENSAVSSTGSGKFRAKLSQDGTSFDYELSYENLEGDVRQGHIHFSQRADNGGISIWLCETATNPSPSASTPTCANPDDPLDTHSGRVTGTITAAEVIGPAAQGIDPGELEEILAAMRAGVAYANVHSSRNTGGEVRGQIK